MGVLIKLLTGLQAGAEMALGPGTYVLGTANEADLLLADAAVRPLHATLVIDGKEWKITPIEDATVCVGGRVVSGTTTLVPYQVITLGGIHMALGPEGPWKELPRIPAPSAEPALSDEQPERNAPSFSMAAQEPGNDQNRPQARSGQRSWPWIVMMLVLLPLLGAAAWYVMHGRHAGSPAAAMAESAAEKLRGNGIAAAYPASGTTMPAGEIGVSVTPEGKIALEGLVATEAERASITRLSGLPEQLLRNDLIAAPEEIEAVAKQLAASHPRMRLTVAPARFSSRLYGLATSGEEGSEAYRLAREMLDSRISIRRALWTWPELKREAEREAARIGIGDARFVFENGEIAIRGDRWPDTDSLKELVGRLRERHGDDTAELFASLLQSPPGSEPVPEPEPEPEPPPIIVVEALPEPEVKSEPAPEPESAPAPAVTEEQLPPPPPLPKLQPLDMFWQVATVTEHGFYDQERVFHKVGGSLPNGVRVVSCWPKGVVLQRGKETIFVNQGSTIFNKK